MILKHRESQSVEFIFDQDSDEPPHLMGSWDTWSYPGIPMMFSEGKWRVTVKLPPDEYQFKYRVGDRWYNDFFADRYVDNGLGGDNSVVIVEKAPARPARPTRRKTAARKIPRR